MRGLILAFTFLTRLPMPRLDDYEDKELSSSANWFPLVGLVIGLLLMSAAYSGMGASPWMAALLVMLVWAGATGALHLDGAADLADALGASHRDPERFHRVMKDPHTGAFGVVAIAAILITKLVAVAWVVQSSEINLWVLLLIPAWARLGAIYWSQTLDAIAPGSGEHFKWAVSERVLWSWGGGLLLLSWMATSLLFAISAIAALLLWRAFLKRRLNGMTGDCLGAGIEYCECFMLLAVGLF